MSHKNSPIRLNKFLATAGEGSRRACDELIFQGRVEVNGEIAASPGVRISPSDHVKIDGRRISIQASIVVAFHKPRGLVCSRKDERQRETIYAALPPALRTLHHTGRLDLDSEGLLILTNDGDLTQRLMHPKSGIEKEYLVTANQAVRPEDLAKLTKGIYGPEGKLIAKRAELLSPRRLNIVLAHGAKRQIRVMLDALGYKVSRLLRVRIGNLWLGDLKPGEHAQLCPGEIALLFDKPAPSALKSHSQNSAKGDKKKRLNRRANPKEPSKPPSPAAAKKRGKNHQKSSPAPKGKSHFRKARHPARRAM